MYGVCHGNGCGAGRLRAISLLPQPEWQMEIPLGEESRINDRRSFINRSFYTGGWADILVPGNWERQGYGTAIYVNESYELTTRCSIQEEPAAGSYEDQ